MANPAEKGSDNFNLKLRISEMISIVKGEEKDFKLLTEISRKSFLETHEKSSAPEDINIYVNQKLNEDTIKDELNDAENIFHMVYYGQQVAGYSKIILNVSHLDITTKNVTKLERLYLLKEFHGLKLGFVLLNFNTGLSRKNSQSGMWCYVWKENHRAVDFYLKMGFKIIGSHNFKITENHSNPNHHMFLEY
jgi:diamine N-acetyltransferase